MDSATGLKRFLEKTGLQELARRMLFRMVMAFLMHRGIAKLKRLLAAAIPPEYRIAA